MLTKMFNWFKTRLTAKASKKQKRGFNSDNPFLIL